MKAKLVFSILFLVACVSLYAQDSTKLTKVFLKDGTSFNAYVEKQADGGYKLTTEEGSTFFFREGEISLDAPFIKKGAKQLAAQGQSQNAPAQKLKYRDLKLMYSAKDYSPEPGDKYSPTLARNVSFFLPGFGQYYTGRIGSGLLYSLVDGVCIYIFSRVAEMDRASVLDDQSLWVAGPLVWVGAGLCSAFSASKVAKIKNLYYRDMRNGVAYKFDVTPYIDVTAPVLASNQNIVTGLSLRVSF